MRSSIDILVAAHGMKVRDLASDLGHNLDVALEPVGDSSDAFVAWALGFEFTIIGIQDANALGICEPGLSHMISVRASSRKMNQKIVAEAERAVAIYLACLITDRIEKNAIVMSGMEKLIWTSKDEK